MVSAAPLVIAWSAFRNVREHSSNVCTACQKNGWRLLKTAVGVSTKRSPQRPLPIRQFGESTATATARPHPAEELFLKRASRRLLIGQRQIEGARAVLDRSPSGSSCRRRGSARKR